MTHTAADGRRFASARTAAMSNWADEHRDHKPKDCDECDRTRFADDIARVQRDELEATNPKVRENRLRRAAERQRIKLEKARMRDPRGIDFGTYRLVDPYTNTVTRADGPGDYGLTLDDVERELGRRDR